MSPSQILAALGPSQILAALGPSQIPATATAETALGSRPSAVAAETALGPSPAAATGLGSRSAADTAVAVTALGPRPTAETAFDSSGSRSAVDEAGTVSLCSSGPSRAEATTAAFRPSAPAASSESTTGSVAVSTGSSEAVLSKRRRRSRSALSLALPVTASGCEAISTSACVSALSWALPVTAAAGYGLRLAKRAHRKLSMVAMYCATPDSCQASPDTDRVNPSVVCGTASSSGMTGSSGAAGLYSRDGRLPGLCYFLLLFLPLNL